MLRSTGMNDVMCGNSACGCHVSEEDEFCSDECANAAANEPSEEGQGGCSCPHAECQVGADIEPVVYSDIGEIE